MDHLCISHSVSSATDWMLHPLPTASNASLLSQLISAAERGFPEFRNLSSASAPPPRGAGPIPLPLLLLLSSFFHPTQLCRDLYSPFPCPGSSASFQLVFCENCCIYRCIPDASTERDELHIHLLLCHLDSLEKVLYLFSVFIFH